MTQYTTQRPGFRTVLLSQDVYDILTEIAELNYRSRRHQAEWMILEEGKKIGIRAKPSTHTQINSKMVEVSAKQ
jgi:hypothetical protein